LLSAAEAGSATRPGDPHPRDTAALRACQAPRLPLLSSSASAERNLSRHRKTVGQGPDQDPRPFRNKSPAAALGGRIPRRCFASVGHRDDVRYLPATSEPQTGSARKPRSRRIRCGHPNPLPQPVVLRKPLVAYGIQPVAAEDREPHPSSSTPEAKAKRLPNSHKADVSDLPPGSAQNPKPQQKG
jgi:hypothetical protein